MAGLTVVQEQPSHVRCSSMPSGSHPIVLRVEEELHKLKACVASSSLSTQMLYNGLKGLGDLYNCIKELLRLPSNQQVFSHLPTKKWLEDELEGSFRLLDLCSALRDGLATKKEHVQDLQLALQRRDAKAIKEKTYTCMSSRQKANKDIKNCLRSLKRWIRNLDLLRPLIRIVIYHLEVWVLMEAREITISLLQSMSSYLLVSRPKAKTSRWSSVSKALHKRKVGCEGEHEDMSDICSMVFSFYASYDCISCKDVDEERALKA